MMQNISSKARLSKEYTCLKPSIEDSDMVLYQNGVPGYYLLKESAQSPSSIKKDRNFNKN